jgi:mono/diheme cytochrome c family protein
VAGIVSRLRVSITNICLAFLGCTDNGGSVSTSVLSRGKALYDLHCSACHGAKLEGQPNWREPLANGKLPAPPHDASGHTWHHSDRLLFNITKNGIEPYAAPGYKSDMPAFRGRLSDEDISAVIAYIKSTWPEENRKLQAEVNRGASH